MARIEEELTELVVEQVNDPTFSEMSNKQPMVLSCGGIFIPRRAETNSELYKILNCANSKEPTKVVTGNVPRNILQEVLHKESMN